MNQKYLLLPLLGLFALSAVAESARDRVTKWMPTEPAMGSRIFQYTVPHPAKPKAKKNKKGKNDKRAKHSSKKK